MPDKKIPLRTEPSFYLAGSLSDAAAALVERGNRGQALAGGTWIMRAALRGEPQDRAYVSLSRIEALRQVTLSGTEIVIGACVTHAHLACELPANAAYESLALAAGKSANPAVRNAATVGGNLCALDFAAADLVPALMCLDAKVEMLADGRIERLSTEEFLKLRATLTPGTLVKGVVINGAKPVRRISTHVRLPLRRAGDYPVAIVSIAVTLRDDDTVSEARIAVGSVEAVPKRWPEMEAAMMGRALDDGELMSHAHLASKAFTGRNGVDAPGWYRVKVLPVLFGRAVARLKNRVQE